MLALAFPALDPVALQIGPLPIRWYTLAYIAGLCLAWLYALRLAGGLTMGMMLSAAMAAAGLALLVHSGRQPPRREGRGGRLLLAGASLVLLSAFSAATPIRYMTQSAINPPERLSIAAEGGTSLTLYAVDVGDASAAAVPRRMLFVSGSGCTSLRHFLSPYLASLRAPYRVYAVQKPGVGDGDLGLTCSDAFHTADTLPLILARQRAALDWLRRGGDGAHGPVTLFGVSEGGGIAVALAAEAGPAVVDRVVVVGSGGLPLRRSLQILASRDQLPIDLDVLSAEVASEPHSVAKRRFGHAHAYWSSMLGADPLPAYLRLQVTTLVLFGERDRSVPVESAWHLRDALRMAGRRNVTVVSIPGADHALHRDGRDLKAPLFRRVSAWLTDGVWTHDPAPEHGGSP